MKENKRGIEKMNIEKILLEKSENGYISNSDLLDLVPLKLPELQYEYSFTLHHLGATTDYGQWRDDLREVMNSQKTKEQKLAFLLEYFKQKFIKFGSTQTSKLMKDKHTIQEIHLILGKNGYMFKQYLGEGKKLTLNEKIDKLKDFLPNSVTDLILSRFTKEHLTQILKGRKYAIKTNPPDTDGIDYYIWRLTRFNCGYDSSLPVMSDLRVKITLNELGIEKSLQRTIIEFIDLLTFRMNIINFKNQAGIGCNIWKKALGYPF